MEHGSEGTEEIVGDGVVWRFDRAFLRSNWTCIWGRGCLGILPEPAEELGQGCCSVGAQLDGAEEAGTIATLARLIEPERFQFHAEATAAGVLRDRGEGHRPDPAARDGGHRPNTRLVDGACIFLNRPGFAGGAGCALHLQAVADGERPMDWKPSVCSQLPIHVDWRPVDAADDTAGADDGAGGDGGAGGRDVAARSGGALPSEQAEVRAWSRPDWGDDGEPMHWCCTEGDRAFVGDRPVVESLAEELVELVGTEVYVELRRRLDR